MMQDPFLESFDASRSIEGKPFPSACYAPFGALYFHTNGDVVACCKSTHHVLGNVAEDRLRSIWRGPRIRAMRAELEAFRFGEACRFCEWQIRSGHEDVHARIFDELEVSAEAETWPTRMDFTLSNVCNLACTMCYGALSSTIRAQRDQLPPLPRVYDERFFSDLREFLPHLRRATFMGGEPFLAGENYRIWDMMIEEALDFPCSVITNGTQWSARMERILEAIPMHISVSIDGVSKSVVESIRMNADFDRVMENTRRIHAYTRERGTRMSLMFCLMQQNRHEFGAYLEFADELDVDVDMNVVVDPEQCSLYSLGSAGLRCVTEELEAQDVGDRFSSLRRNGRVWRRTLASLRNSVNALDRRGQAAPTGPAPSAPSQDALTRAWESLRSGEPRAALESLAEIGPNDARAYQALLCGAQAERQLGDLAAAAERLDRAVTMWPRGAQALVQRGWLHLDLARVEDAVVDATRACTSLAESDDERLRSEANRLLASAHVAEGRLEAALERLGEVRGADEYEAATTSAWIQRELGRLEAAEATLERAIELAPERTQAYVERAWLRRTQGRISDAIESALQAEQRLTTERRIWDAPSVHHVLAESLRADSQFAPALPHARELVALRPGNPSFLLLQAMLEFALGDSETARRTVAEARDAGGDEGEIAALLERIDTGR